MKTLIMMAALAASSTAHAQAVPTQAYLSEVAICAADGKTAEIIMDAKVKGFRQADIERIVLANVPHLVFLVDYAYASVGETVESFSGKVYAECMKGVKE